jgi:xanthine phosphoribosyltransferase
MTMYIHIKVVIWCLASTTAAAFSFHRASSPQLSSLFAKRNKKLSTDIQDLNRWYEGVDGDATPDNVFWEEMERQRLLTELGTEKQTFTATTSTSAVTFSNTVKPSMTMQEKYAQQQTVKSTEATLAEYGSFMVDNNWLDEDLRDIMMEQEMNGFVEDDIEEKNKLLDDELDELLAEPVPDNNMMWRLQSDEPWDRWGQLRDVDTEDTLQMEPNTDSEFLFDDSADDDDEADKMEAELLERIGKIGIYSERLEKASRSTKAKTYFSRPPDEVEGFDRMWVSAIDNVCFNNLVGVMRNYGIQFADNFGDWMDGSEADGLFTIEDIASFKARKVFEVTGLPCVSSRTSFEIEPIPTSSTGPRSVGQANPRVTSGYRFNNVGMHVDHMIQALKPLSEETRVTRFRTCLCYYDGEVEIYDYGICDVDMYFANSLRTFIPVSAAINELCKTLQLTFGLDYQRWLNAGADQKGIGVGAASVQLRDRVLKDGRVLPNSIIDVSSFMDSMVDVNLMDDCAKELVNRFADLKPSKILTVATTGLVIALPMAKYLNVPCVYARKERNVVMADTFRAGYSSKTVGKSRELLVSRSHLDEDDRVLVIDDFLSSGSSQEALLRIVAESGATAVGVGVLLEKVYDSGRRALSGFNVPIHSLCRVASVKEGVIQIVEEDGFDQRLFEQSV